MTESLEESEGMSLIMALKSEVEGDEVGVRHVRNWVPKFCHDKSVNIRPNNGVFASGISNETWINSSAMYKRKAKSPQPSQWKESKREHRRKLSRKA